MTMKSTAIAAAVTALMIIAAPAAVLAQAAPGNGNPGNSDAGAADGGAEAGGGTYGFGSPYHNFELDASKNCDSLRKRAQWSDSYHWWREYSRCVGN